MIRVPSAPLYLVALMAVACGDGTTPNDSEPKWEVLLQDLPGALLRVFGTGPNDVYAVGADGDGNGSLVYHFNGQTLSKLEPGTRGDLWWGHSIGADDVRFGGEAGLILRYRPSANTFETLPSPSPSDTVFGLWGTGPDNVWYVGGLPAGPRSAVWRDEGEGARALMDLPVSTSSTTIFKVHGFDDGTVWMVGQRGRGWRHNGGVWTETSTATNQTLFTVHGLTADRVFAVGGTIRGVLLAFDGAGWIDETPPGAAGLNGVFAASDGLVYAAGFNGSIYERDASGTWGSFEAESPTLEDLHSIWVDSSGAIWAVGGLLSADPPTRGVLLRYGPPLGL